MSDNLKEWKNKDIEKIDELVRYLRKVDFPQEIELVLETLTKFLERLNKEKN